MTRKCIYPNCEKSSVKYSLYSFPSCPIRRHEWLTAMGIVEHKIGKDDRVCGRHFEPKHITKSNRTSLEAVPTHVISATRYDKPLIPPEPAPVTLPEPAPPNDVIKANCEKFIMVPLGAYRHMLGRMEDLQLAGAKKDAKIRQLENERRNCVVELRNVIDLLGR